jgi:glycosyltransferase involved in cell wall biosynthesis
MKIALVHDYIKEYGGAERVLEALHEIFPDAPVFTTVYLPEFLGPHRDRFKDWEIKTSILQLLPFKSKLISPIRIAAPFIFKNFDFSSYDLIIVSATGAYNPNNINKKNAILVCYCHTPPRYLYGYATAREWKNSWVFRILGNLANHFLRIVDFNSSQNVDYFIANSKNIAARIKKFYRKESTVIYPPVELNPRSENQNPKRKNNKSYFLAGGRLARPKHIDLIVETFKKLNQPLKIFGRGFAGAEDQLLEKKGKNIDFVGEVSDKEKLDLMRNAKAFVIAAEDEDFGITPVEAQSVGTPVIAYRSGGVLESVSEGKTGLFFDNLSIESLSDEVKKFDKIKFNREEIINHSQKFSKERFKKEIKDFVKKVYGNT